MKLLLEIRMGVAVFIVFLLMCSSILLAQNGYQTILKHPNHHIGTASICGLSDGSALVAALLGDSTVNIIGHHLTKIDSSGHIIWGKDYNISNGWASFVSVLSDSSIVLTGGHNSINGSLYFVQSLDSLGNTKWSKGFRPQGTNSLSYGARRPAIETKNQKMLLTGEVNINNLGRDIFLMSLDFSGNINWAKRFGELEEQEYYPVINTTVDGGCIMTFSIERGNYFDFCVLKVDSIGNIQWSKQYGRKGQEYPASINQTNDGGYTVVGMSPNQTTFASQILLFKINSIGTLQWSKSYDTPATYIGLDSKVLHDNSIVISATIDLGTINSSMALIKTDSLGNVVWSKSFATNTITTGFDNIVNSHVLSAGYSSYYNSDSVFIVKSDLSGNNDCHEKPFTIYGIPQSILDSVINIPNTPLTMLSFNVSIQDTSQTPIYWRCSNISVPELRLGNPAYNISPNPCDSHLTLEIPNEVTKPALLIIASATGKEVLRQQLDFNAQNKHVLNTLGLSSGIYVLTLSDKNGTLLYRQKVVKL